MPGKSLNLIINKDKESSLLKKLNILSPVIALAALVFFILIFLFSIIYVNTNIAQFNNVKKESELLEKKISNLKNVEGIYTLTLLKINALSSALENSKNFNSVISEVNKLKSDEINLNSASVDENGNISFNIEASSSASLDNFINILLAKEQQKVFSEIYAAGIARDKKGTYTLNIALKGDKSLFK